MHKRWCAVPYVIWMAIFTVIPLLLIFYYSFTTNDGSSFTLEHFQRFFEPIYLKVAAKSFQLAFISTVLCLLIGYPIAYMLSKKENAGKGFLLFLFIMPMWMNFLLRTYSWLTILGPNGILNTFLRFCGLPQLKLLYTNTAVVIGMVYNFLPFMILPIYSVLKKLDPRLIEAAEDLGADKIMVFRKVILPFSLPGIATGITMVFMPSLTTFVITNLLGGGQLLIGNLIEQQFMTVGDWGFGSAISVIMMLVVIISMVLFGNSDNGGSTGGLMG